jgi:predicted DNA-binding transcriptional regulator AlpA
MARGEVTGRKPGTGTDLNKEPTPRLALSIPEFCEAHGISEGMFYKMKKQNRGLTPREMKIGTRTLITFEAAAKWRAEREAASTAPPEKARAKREQAA